MLKIVLSAALFLTSVPSFADEDDAGGSEVWQNIKSPVTTNAKYSLMSGSGLTLALLALKHQVGDPAQKEAVDNKPLGSSSKWGDQLGQLYPNLVYVIGMYGYGKLAENSRALRDASLMMQATLYSSVVTTVLKYTVREPRPNNKDIKNSFPSGHSTTIFALAGYVGCRHSLPWGVAAYAAAGFVAFSRMNDNAHYLHDVAAGGTIGTAYGVGVCLAERSKEQNLKPINTVGFLVPIERGLAVGLNHTF